ncbi:MAG TPA: fatty acid oxidation complex subunit alpha FadJ [Gemmatimonadaceae bacterium]|nr:fatty acid oxidation complex subunit alpha FadJ [Gemmatimonadaceae bacterium]
MSESPLHVEIRDDIAVITVDQPGAAVNTIDRAMRDAFRQLFDELERDNRVKAAVLRSGKPDMFIAGADIEEFLAIESAREAESLSRDGHALLERIETHRVPVVAAIGGPCLGGALETVLACAWRVASDSSSTVLALPEVQLGLIPGAGGTQRLPRLVGLQAALDMILTGRNVRAKKALQIGLVHELVHPSILDRIALERAREFASGKRGRGTSDGTRRHGARELLLDDNRLGRSVVLRKAREATLKKTHGHFPAPLAALDAVAAGYSGSRENGYREEARLFGELAVSEVSRQLVFLFFATTALKKDPGVAPPVPEALPVRKIGVLGAGFMGAGIAGVAVGAGTIVRMKDADHGRVGRGLAAVRERLDERLRKRQITRQQLLDQMTLLGGTMAYTGFDDVDLVIEAVFEDLDIKRHVLREVEEVGPERMIVASNTSTIPIARIAEASRRPERVLGMHFFSPVHRMPLLEVIPHAGTAPRVTATAVAYGKKLGKTVIVVNDAPGFYVNRILAPYVGEAGRLLDEGAAIDAIDKAMMDAGFPVGPITLIDEVGLDIAGKSGAIMFEAFGERLAPSESLRRVVESGRSGRKGKSGFYSYDESGQKRDVDDSVYDLLPGGRERREIPPSEIQMRCLMAMANEAARCLESGIIRSPRDGDVGAVFGIGFPPFRGGPFRYLDSTGIASATRILESLYAKHTPRFEPAGILVEMARRGTRFYPERGHPLEPSGSGPAR